jgi:hypothetical protein
MTERNKAFDEWYRAEFGHFEGHDDSENREAVKKIWNSALESAARQFEFQIFDEMCGDAVADRIRRMQAVAS